MKRQRRSQEPPVSCSSPVWRGRRVPGEANDRMSLVALQRQLLLLLLGTRYLLCTGIVCGPQAGIDADAVSDGRD